MLPASGQGATANLPPNVTWLDAMPDRKKFIAIVPEKAGPGSVTVVQNWRAALATGR